MSDPDMGGGGGGIGIPDPDIGGGGGGGGGGGTPLELDIGGGGGGGGMPLELDMGGGGGGGGGTPDPIFMETFMLGIDFAGCRVLTGADAGWAEDSMCVCICQDGFLRP